MSKSGILSGNQPYLFDTKNLFFRCQVIFVFYYLIVLPLFLFGVRFSLEVSLFFLLFLLFMLLLPLSCAFHFTPYSFYRRHVISCFGFNKVCSTLRYSALRYSSSRYSTLAIQLVFERSLCMCKQWQNQGFKGESDEVTIIFETNSISGRNRFGNVWEIRSSVSRGQISYIWGMPSFSSFDIIGVGKLHHNCCSDHSPRIRGPTLCLSNFLYSPFTVILFSNNPPHCYKIPLTCEKYICVSLIISVILRECCMSWVVLCERQLSKRPVY